MKLRHCWFLLVLLPCFAFAGSNDAGAFKAGVEYELMGKPQPTQTGEKVEVLELFWYGCPHCYKLEPFIDQWLENKPANATYIRLPAVFSAGWMIHAKAFYAAEAMGILDKVHKPLFDALHAQKKKIYTPETIADFFATLGVDRAEFLKTYKSFAVTTKANRAKQMTRRYGISGVPAVIVNGKYRTSAHKAGSEGRLMQVINALIAKESK